jgi:GH35 family endo-1,4-beta-xylanase
VSPLDHRRGLLDVRVLGPDGAPVDSPVTVRQVSHDFGFGNIGFELMDVATGAAASSDLVEPWLNLFNQATLAFYWRGFEPAEGAPDTVRLLAAAKWFKDRGVRLKGHPLTWHTMAPQWLIGRPLAEVETTLRERIAREVTAFAGVVDQWDAINEAVIMPRFVAEENAITPLAAALGRVEMVRLGFETARAASPVAKLVLNDFLLTEEYARLIEECLAAGIAIDAIGLQTHMHQGFRGEDELGKILERFEVFGLPLQFTEVTLVSGDLMPPDIVDLNDYQVEHWPSTAAGEARQAGEATRLYRLAAEHPLVESVTWWGLCDRDMWLRSPGGLLRADATRKPAYDALHELIRGEWWVSEHIANPDPNGTVRVTGWGGDYELSTRGKAAVVHVTAGASGRADAVLA